MKNNKDLDAAESYYSLCDSNYFRQQTREYNNQQYVRLSGMMAKTADYISQVGEYYLNSINKYSSALYDL